MSETDFLKLKKHDNVETNTDKFDIENYLNGNWDKINENAKKVNTDISNIKKEQETQNTNIEENNSKIVELQTEKAKLETELKEMQEDFYQNSIRGQASGEYIHVEDSSNCRARIGIGGNSEQETRAGYNKLNMSNAKGGTSGGITCVINEDGSYQFKGTATTTDNGTVNVWFLGYYNSKAPTLFTLEAGTYYINDVLLFSGIKKLNEPLKKIYTFTSEVNITGVRAMSATPGQTYNEVKYPIIAKSNKELTWEQYGASPSPDYPSEIKTVGSNVNLFDKDNYIKSKLYINKNENKFSEASMGKSFIFDISKYNKLTISKVSSERFGVFASVDYPQKDGVGTYLQDAATNTTSFSYDFAKFNYLVVFYYFSRDTLTEQEILDSIKIVEGTEIGEYSKYGQGCVKVTKCNENILDTSITKNVKNQNGEERIGYFCQITKTGKYYLMLNTANTLYFGKSTDLNSATTLIGSTSSTFSTTYDFNEGEYFVLWGTKTEKDKIMVILSNKQQKYIEHQEETYIMPIQQEMLQGDYFDFDNEEEVHIWGKTVLTGDENWKLESTGRFGIIKSDLPEIPAATSNDNDYLGNMCNSYKESTPVLTWKKVQGFCVDMSSCLRIYDDKYSTNNDLEGFKAYLKSKYDAGTPVMIYYKLQTPTRLAFTAEQKAVAKELTNARTYKNATNITTDSKAILSLDYAKDQETQNQKMQNEIDEIKQLLSTTQTSALLLDNMQTDIESEVE